MKVYEVQQHGCPFSEMQADHIIPWSRGGKTTEDNCQLLCEYHNKHKSDN